MLTAKQTIVLGVILLGAAGLWWAKAKGMI